MRKVGGELRQKGKVTLLSRGKRCACFGNGGDKRFVVSKEGEKTTF
jgi:hypothetical protein